MMAIGPPLGVHPGAQIKGIAVWRSARVFAPCMLAVRVRVSLSPLLLFLRPPRPSERVVATLDLSAPPPWPPRWRAPASCSFRALLFRFVPFPRGSFPPSPSWSPRPPGTPRGTPARSKRRDRDARGRWFAFPFRSSLPAAHDDREQSAAKTSGSRRRRPGRGRGTGGISLWGHPRGTRELVGSIDIGTVLAGDADRAAGT